MPLKNRKKEERKRMACLMARWLTQPSVTKCRPYRNLLRLRTYAHNIPGMNYCEAGATLPPINELARGPQPPLVPCLASARCTHASAECNDATGPPHATIYSTSCSVHSAFGVGNKTSESAVCTSCSTSCSTQQRLVVLEAKSDRLPIIVDYDI